MDSDPQQQPPAQSELVNQFLDVISRQEGDWTIFEPQPGRGNERQIQWENKVGDQRLQIFVYEFEGKLQAYAGGEKNWTLHDQHGVEWQEWQDYEIKGEYSQQEGQSVQDFFEFVFDNFLEARPPLEPYVEEHDYDDVDDSVNALVANLLEDDGARQIRPIRPRYTKGAFKKQFGGPQWREHFGGPEEGKNQLDQAHHDFHNAHHTAWKKTWGGFLGLPRTRGYRNESETKFDREEREALANATPEQLADRRARKEKLSNAWRNHQAKKLGRPLPPPKR